MFICGLFFLLISCRFSLALDKQPAEYFARRSFGNLLDEFQSANLFVRRDVLCLDFALAARLEMISAASIGIAYSSAMRITKQPVNYNEDDYRRD